MRGGRGSDGGASFARQHYFVKGKELNMGIKIPDRRVGMRVKAGGFVTDMKPPPLRSWRTGG